MAQQQRQEQQELERQRKQNQNQKLLVVALVVTSSLLVAVVAGVCLRLLGGHPWGSVLADSATAFVAAVGVEFLFVTYIRS